MQKDKLKVITERKSPKDVKEIQQFLGICNYYRRFIKDYAKVAKALFYLLKKETPFVWNDEQENAFKELKNRLVSYPILRQPDFSKPFLIFTDASNYAIGAVLAQTDDDKHEYVVAYASRLMKGAEINYGITEKECFAVVWTVKQFRNYLFGTEFKIITDHSALAWLMAIKEPTGRLARWAIYLQAYTFTLVHRSGIIHSNADTLSRPPIEQINSIRIDEERFKDHDPYEDGCLIYFIKFGRHINGASRKQVNRVNKAMQKYEFKW